jgi:hypothetical protein
MEGLSLSPPAADASGPIEGKLGLKFRELRSGGSGGSLAKIEPLQVGLWTAVGGEFRRAGWIAAGFELPMPGLLLADAQGFHAPAGLLLHAGSSVQAIGLSADGTHLCLGGLLILVPAQVVLPMLHQAYIACGDGASWKYAIGADGPNGPVHAFAADPQSGMLYVGGGFSRVAGRVVDGIAALAPQQGSAPLLNPQAWRSVGGGLRIAPTATFAGAHGDVNSLLYAGNGLVVVGGVFTRAIEALDAQAQPMGAAIPAWNLVVWNAQTQAWMPVGDAALSSNQAVHLNGVAALTLSPAHLGVGGRFEWVGHALGPEPALVHARGWALRELQLQDSGPQAWTVPAADAWGKVRALAWTGQGMLAGGSFAFPDDQGEFDENLRTLLLWHDGQLEGQEAPLWIDPEDHAHFGQPSRVQALSADGDRLCAGGMFSDTVQGIAVGNLACRNSSTQQELYAGQGTDRAVQVLQSFWQMDVHQP